MWCKNITGRKVDILYSEWPKDISLIEKRNFIGNISKYKSITGWLPKTPLIDGLNKMIH